MSDRKGWRRFLALRRAGVPKDQAARALDTGTFVMDAEWNRSEELRPERLGPSVDDIEDPERVRVERWRPAKGLGPLPRR